MLSCKTEALTQPAISELIVLLKGAEFAHMMKPVAGYAPDNAGEIVTLDKVFPWPRRVPVRRQSLRQLTSVKTERHAAS